MWGIEIEKKMQDILAAHDPKYPEEYSKGYFYRSNPLFLPKTHMREALVFLLDCKVPPTARILDFGCGTGQMLLFLAKFGYQNLFGWDANERWLSGAREIFRQLADPNAAQFRCVDRDCIYNIKGADSEGFDAITMFVLIYGHGIDTARTLASVAEALKPGGFFIFNDGVHEAEMILEELRRTPMNLHRRIQIASAKTIDNNIYFCPKRRG
jgi:SAM-dependent methyltransferase